jgi:hypothetical protein
MELLSVTQAPTLEGVAGPTTVNKDQSAPKRLNEALHLHCPRRVKQHIETDLMRTTLEDIIIHIPYLQSAPPHYLETLVYN